MIWEGLQNTHVSGHQRTSKPLWKFRFPEEKSQHTIREEKQNNERVSIYWNAYRENLDFTSIISVPRWHSRGLKDRLVIPPTVERKSQWVNAGLPQLCRMQLMQRLSSSEHPEHWSRSSITERRSRQGEWLTRLPERIKWT